MQTGEINQLVSKSTQKNLNKNKKIKKIGNSGNRNRCQQAGTEQSKGAKMGTPCRLLCEESRPRRQHRLESTTWLPYPVPDASQHTLMSGEQPTYSKPNNPAGADKKIYVEKQKKKVNNPQNFARIDPFKDMPMLPSTPRRFNSKPRPA